MEETVARSILRRFALCSMIVTVALIAGLAYATPWVAVVSKLPVVERQIVIAALWLSGLAIMSILTRTYWALQKRLATDASDSESTRGIARAGDPIATLQGGAGWAAVASFFAIWISPFVFRSPLAFTANQVTGQTCPALLFSKGSGSGGIYYYLTPSDCVVYWTIAAPFVVGLVLLVLCSMVKWRAR